MHFLREKCVSLAMCIVAMGLIFSGLAMASEGGATMSAEGALKKLLEGNKHYVSDNLTNQTQSNAAARIALAGSQKPYAIILTCSDSRVPPELIFDKGLGEIFVIRVAGNVPDPIVLGSIEYAAEHLGSPLIMVLGHERCGAVTAAVDSGGKSTGSPNIDAIVHEIKPSVEQAIHNCGLCNNNKDCAKTHKKGFVECVIETNTKAVADNLTKRSVILKHLVEAKKMTIVAAKYDLDDGTVSLLK